MRYISIHSILFFAQTHADTFSNKTTLVSFAVHIVTLLLLGFLYKDCTSIRTESKSGILCSSVYSWRYSTLHSIVSKVHINSLT